MRWATPWRLRGARGTRGHRLRHRPGAGGVAGRRRREGASSIVAGGGRCRGARPHGRHACPGRERAVRRGPGSARARTRCGRRWSWPPSDRPPCSSGPIGWRTSRWRSSTRRCPAVSAEPPAGDLLVMVGGSDAAVQRARPVLDAIAGHAPVVGSAPGDGQKVKLVNQLLCGVHIAVAAEALAYAEAMGLDAAATFEVVRGGAAASFMLDDRGERMVGTLGRGQERARPVRQGHGPRHRRRALEQLPHATRDGRRAALPRRTPRRAGSPRRLQRDRDSPGSAARS